MIGNNWDIALKDIYNSDYFKELMNKVNDEYKEKEVYPEYENIFNAFKLTDFNNVKVVILGQDPYHGDGEAHGLSFSVRDNVKLPPSLKNIYKELYSDLLLMPSNRGNLTCWAKEGVLLLNSTLTVLKDKPNSHKDLGWSRFTDDVIRLISDKKNNVVFILWGNFAREKKELIDLNKHFVIESAHPSPFSARNGFFGSKPFSKTNDYLKSFGITPVDWDLHK